MCDCSLGQFSFLSTYRHQQNSEEQGDHGKDNKQSFSGKNKIWSIHNEGNKTSQCGADRQDCGNSNRHSYADDAEASEDRSNSPACPVNKDVEDIITGSKSHDLS